MCPGNKIITKHVSTRAGIHNPQQQRYRLPLPPKLGCKLKGHQADKLAVHPGSSTSANPLMTQTFI